MPLPRPIAAAALAIAAISLTAACASESAPAGQPRPAEAVTVDNCGFELSLTTPPRRIVTVKSTTTEMLLALGLGDRIVGAAFLDGPVPERWAEQGAQIPVISDFAPSQEAVLELEPDLVYAGWESNLAADTAGERDVLARLGVGSYVAPSACKAPEYQPDRLDFELVFEEIEEAGRIFGAQAAAADLIAEQRRRLDALTPSDAGLSALWYSSGSDTPYVGAGIGAPQMMLESAGLQNIAGDVPDTWTALGWEPIIEADPDVIILVDAEWNTAAEKIERLKANPATATMSAVVADRFITVPFAAGEAGVRNVEAVESILAQLAELGLG